jgi:hypothetical protein
MRRFLAVLLMIAFPVLGFAATITWDAPATYEDGSPVGAADLARVEYHLYVDMEEFAVVPGGVTTWDGDLPQKPGETKSYTCTAVLDGVASRHSDPTIYVYYIPLAPPAHIQIQLK